jgi:hypothetical protein
MRTVLLAISACTVALLVAAPVQSAPRTTNQPAIFTVKVTITDRAIVMHPNHAARGSMVTFIMTNRGKKAHTFVIGDVKRGAGYGQGFQQALRPDQQFTKVMYLDYRGSMKILLRSGKIVTAHGVFRIT